MIDPIDGTKNFVRGVPVWATLIALMDGDEPVVGLVSAPALGTPLVGGARTSAPGPAGGWSGHRLPRVARWPTWPTRACPTPASPAGRSAAARRLPGPHPAVWRTRAYGDFWSYMLVAEGAVDIACEPEVSLWDLAALDVIVREAGGRFTDLAGDAGPGRRQRRGHQRPPAPGRCALAGVRLPSAAGLS